MKKILITGGIGSTSDQYGFSKYIMSRIANQDNNTRLINEIGNYKFVDITEGINKLNAYYKSIKD